MESMNFCRRESTISLQLSSMPDLRVKLFAKNNKDERISRITEERYGPKVLEGNWFDRRAELISVTDEWTTTHKTNYKPYGDKDLINDKTEYRNNKAIYQGLNAEILFGHHENAYQKNISTTYDLSYRVLPKSLHSPRIRTFNARKNKWIPEQDYMQDYGNLTECGLMEFMKCKWSVESREPIRPWQTNYQVEYRKKNISTMSKRFPRRSVDMNRPNLQHLAVEPPSYFSCLVPYKLKEPLLHEANIECTRKKYF